MGNGNEVWGRCKIAAPFLDSSSCVADFFTGMTHSLALLRKTKSEVGFSTRAVPALLDYYIYVYMYVYRDV